MPFIGLNTGPSAATLFRAREELRQRKELERAKNAQNLRDILGYVSLALGTIGPTGSIVSGLGGAIGGAGPTAGGAPQGRSFRTGGFR